MVWIGYEKAYNMVPQRWIIGFRRMYKKSYKFHMKAKKNWKVELTTGGKNLPEVEILRDIFLGDVLSPLSFIIVMNPPS